MILASASPRRKRLLREHGIRFRAVASRIPEPPPKAGEDPVSYAKKLAFAKALAVAGKTGKGWVLGADTVVVLGRKIYGKPASVGEARRILKKLQGTTHRVITAVALVNAASGKRKVGHAVSRVTMRPLSTLQISRYAKKHPDKAGAYAVQEKMDPVVVRIRGSYTNVVGLPMELVKRMIKTTSCCSTGRAARA
ncbi:MAG: Maf family protein [Candidatus Omnitrophica bacterium]|nr:Maf family protein [Candidatus Omnitrophota bacterium]